VSWFASRHSIGNVLGVLVLVLFGSITAAEDTVVLSSPNNLKARTKVTGRVVDYSGRGLELELASGSIKHFDADQIFEIKTEATAAEQAGDALFARREFSAAMAKYEQALRDEQRRWVRRKLMAQRTACLMELGRAAQAGDNFLLLVGDDPTTPYFDQIPLNWLPGQPDAAVEQKAKEWLAKDQSPAAVLLGASYLLSTADGPAALSRLERLTADADPRISALAEAQSWRGRFTSATDQQLDLWNHKLERFPATVRAGPYLVLGRAQLYRRQYEQAALTLLRVPILYPESRVLAAEALWSAGQALEQVNQVSEAKRLYGELVARYPESRQAAEATEKLK
jgi:tetratricopeptide (TPR) repeat protein